MNENYFSNKTFTIKLHLYFINEIFYKDTNNN